MIPLLGQSLSDNEEHAHTVQHAASSHHVMYLLQTIFYSCTDSVSLHEIHTVLTKGLITIEGLFLQSVLLSVSQYHTANVRKCELLSLTM